MMLRRLNWHSWMYFQGLEMTFKKKNFIRTKVKGYILLTLCMRFSIEFYQWFCNQPKHHWLYSMSFTTQHDQLRLINIKAISNWQAPNIQRFAPWLTYENRTKTDVYRQLLTKLCAKVSFKFLTSQFIKPWLWTTDWRALFTPYTFRRSYTTI